MKVEKYGMGEKNEHFSFGFFAWFCASLHPDIKGMNSAGFGSHCTLLHTFRTFAQCV